MKTNQIAELTWNVVENKRVASGPWSVARRRIPCDVPDSSVIEALNVVLASSKSHAVRGSRAVGDCSVKPVGQSSDKKFLAGGHIPITCWDF